MKTGIKKLRLFKSGLWAFLLLCGALAVQASSIVTYTVDMSERISSSNFDPAVNQVQVKGSFDGWGAGKVLTNDPSGANTNLFFGTITNTTELNGYPTEYKFYNSRDGQWDDGAVNNSGKNRNARLPSLSGASLVLPIVFFGDKGPQVTNTVTFRVDMAQQVNIGAFSPNAHTLSARGTLNGWGSSFTLTNDPSIQVTQPGGIITSNVYVGTCPVSSGTNGSVEFKYAFTDGIGTSWEEASPTNAVENDKNRFLINIGDQVLPIVYYKDVVFDAALTNDVTFQVDMTAQIFAGNFNPGAGNTAEVRGSFNGWAAPVSLTNDLAAPNTNIYSTVLRIVDTRGGQIAYKFTYSNPGVNWESGTPKLTTRDTGPNDYNRVFNLTTNLGVTANVVLPTVMFDDKKLNDYLAVDSMVAFSVDMNGAVGTDSHVFDSNQDTVWINGEFANWYIWWGQLNAVAGNPQYQMFPAGGGIYTNTILVPHGKRVSMGYKYGIGNGAIGDLGPKDNEAPSGQDHHRAVRSTATGLYTMPQDKFGNQYGEPFFDPLAKAGGQLKVGAPSAGSIPISWLGRPGAHLQSATSIAGPWISHTNTDGSYWSNGVATTNGLMSVTNWPASGTTFFRLTKP
jgi:hypothetical protein